jgi:Rho-binding antiterminator
MISCGQYDYIEIACMYRFPVRLTLRSNDVVEGIAMDTQLNENREECIKVESEGVERLVVLDDLSKLEVCVDNPHFKVVSFD